MKRILIFSLHYYPKHVGGAEVAIKEITDRIDPAEIEFHMVCLRMDSTLPKVEKISNVLVHRIGPSRPSPSATELKKFPLHYNKHLFQALAFIKAVQLHRRYRYEAIWAMMAHSCGVPAALFNLFFPRVGYVLTLQEGDPPEHIERLARPVWPLFTRAFTRATVIQTISSFLAEWARRLGYKGQVEVIPNAVDIAHFSKEYTPSDLAQHKQELGKEDGDIFLITTSRLVHKNAVDDVIKALPHMDACVKFLILGIGPDEEKLKALAKEEGVAERVHFLGQIDHSEMPKHLKISDIFIRPSRSEGMGNSFIEAMAAGIPVIATQEGGIADFLFDPERNPDKAPTGRAVAPNDPEGIARTVKLFLDSPDQTQSIVQNARALVRKKYDWNMIARDMQEKVFARVGKTAG